MTEGGNQVRPDARWGCSARQQEKQTRIRTRASRRVRPSAPKRPLAAGSSAARPHRVPHPRAFKVAAYRYLARYTPDRDLKRPVDK
jgi:hypothetical protein